MRTRPLALLTGLAVAMLFCGCATTDEPVSQKERERMEREMERANRKNQQEQNRALRDPTRDPTQRRIR